ncbi:DUF4349 domain-containing protein [Micromonospora cathayae]|uniref:DUF4349 domain-containing protein n=1 Tax=Micromonospora cathayae TaxID=3028804 RepID=A0ABY7ZV06_9ACTN|nr:DUF4349 domain-containing protein [Micromonospora sp. HUAS 3]WDZ86800.1 DUF4349 domain-containing protein [Micromonospora sp. HUAS 3]
MVEIGRRRWGAALLAGGLVAVLAVGGCSADSRSGSDSTAENADRAPAAGAPAPAAPGKGEAPADAGESGGGDAAAPGGAGGADLRVDQRSIIYNGSITVQVKDVDQAARDAITLVTTAGGFVGGDQRRTVHDAARADLRLRVPAAKFTGTVDEIAKLGEQQRREIQTEDVTEETIDLDARIVTQRARVENARRLLARASSIGDLVSLENELGRREADLASLEAKKRRLADLTALSTLDVSLVGAGARPVDEDDDGSGFLAGLTDSWRVFLDSVTVLVTLLGALLPWLVVLGVPGWLLWRLLRRRRQRRPAPGRPGPFVPAPAMTGVGGPPGGPPAGPRVPAARPGEPAGAPGGSTGVPGGAPTTPGGAAGAPGVSGPPPVPGARSAP